MNYEIILGVSIGGLITFFTNYCLEKQKEKKEIKLYHITNLSNAYIDFKILHGKISTRNIYDSNGKRKPYDDDREFNELREKVNALVDLYFPAHLKEVANDINKMISPNSANEADRKIRWEELDIEIGKILKIKY